MLLAAAAPWLDGRPRVGRRGPNARRR